MEIKQSPQAKSLRHQSSKAKTDGCEETRLTEHPRDAREKSDGIRALFDGVIGDFKWAPSEAK